MGNREKIKPADAPIAKTYQKLWISLLNKKGESPATVVIVVSKIGRIFLHITATTIPDVVLLIRFLILSVSEKIYIPAFTVRPHTRSIAAKAPLSNGMAIK